MVLLYFRFDNDRSGNIDASELQQALMAFGYRVWVVKCVCVCVCACVLCVCVCDHLEICSEAHKMIVIIN